MLLTRLSNDPEAQWPVAATESVTVELAKRPKLLSEALMRD